MEKLIYSTRSVNLTVSQTSDKPITQQVFLYLFSYLLIYIRIISVLSNLEGHAALSKMFL